MRGLLALCLVGALGVAEAAAGTGKLIQKPSDAGCLSVIGFCTPAIALDGAEEITLSPDGQSAYVASLGSGAVVAFDRTGDGTLIQKKGPAACLSDTGAGRCRDGTALSGASSVAVSPDGKSAYVASQFSHAVAVFDRRRNGRLVQKPGTAGCISDTGAGPCVDGTALDQAESVTVSPGGQNVYVTSLSSNAVAVFDRDRDGTLTQKPGTAGCISETGIRCADGTALDGAQSVTISPDGRNAYVASTFSDAVAVFDRRRNGKLVQKPGTAGCISGSGAGPCVDGTALNFPTSVALSPDGQSAYVSTFTSDAVAVFNRAANGTLAQKRGTAGCVREGSGAGRCAGGAGLDAAQSVAVSPDGQNAYIASAISDAVALFDREASRSRRRTR